ncbi:MAG: hypothetical protein ACO26U_14835, partial [Burkholderiaceae bacterium]
MTRQPILRTRHTPKALQKWAAASLLAIAAALQPGLSVAQTSADAKVLNLYSARHYQTDEQLYADFTSQTGIRINRIEAG